MVFTPELLMAMKSRECRWRTELEAASGGPYRIVQRGESYALMADTEPDDGTPVAEFAEEQWALLFAATRGSRARSRRLQMATQPDPEGRYPIFERTFPDERIDLVGLYFIPGDRDLEAVHVAEYLLRNPRRLAYLLEAAGPSVLKGAAAILARRLGLLDPGTESASEAEEPADEK